MKVVSHQQAAHGALQTPMLLQPGEGLGQSTDAVPAVQALVQRSSLRAGKKLQMPASAPGPGWQSVASSHVSRNIREPGSYSPPSGGFKPPEGHPCERTAVINVTTRSRKCERMGGHSHMLLPRGQMSPSVTPPELPGTAPPGEVGPCRAQQVGDPPSGSGKQAGSPTAGPGIENTQWQPVGQSADD